MIPVLHKSIERKAHRIEDPIARLRYLKSRMAAANAPAKPRRSFGRLPAIGMMLTVAVLLSPGYQASNTEDNLPPLASAPHIAPPAPKPVAKVWLVDKDGDDETYSNGLRIDDRYAVSNQSRLFYPVYQRTAIDAEQPEWRSEPAGIVYPHHRKRSGAVRRRPERQAQTDRPGRCCSYISRNHCYHFLIDRFGQVFRVVQESDVAYHAGNSVWADDQVRLRQSEHQLPGHRLRDADAAGPGLGRRPIRRRSTRRACSRRCCAASIDIPATNCVTHAQVSVNPANMLVGYHTDWAGNFPFQRSGPERQLPRAAGEHLRVRLRVRPGIRARHRRAAVARSGARRGPVARRRPPRRASGFAIPVDAAEEVQGGSWMRVKAAERTQRGRACQHNDSVE